MSQQIINVGATANDGTGDTLRLSQQKANLNFTELYGSKLDSVVAGTNVTIDNTDPLNPIISSTGGGGSQTLADTLVLGNTTAGENISISSGDAIILDNGSLLKKGTIDAGYGGSKGISQICAVGYELKWEAGRLYVMGDGGTTIREVSHNFTTTPAATDDVAKGFIVGSRWILDNGDLYICTDNTSTAAVWVLQPNIPTKTSDLINDGDDGISHFISLNDLPSNVILYPTNVASDISTYYKIVSSITDPSYNTTAVDISTGSITTTSQLISSLATPANIIVGNPGVFNITTIGNIRRTSGSGTASFYFKVYKRTSAGTETLITTSDNTIPVLDSGTYVEFSATALWNYGIFLSTDRIVLKFYANRIAGGSNPTYEFQFGGTTPVRSLLPIPLSVVPVLKIDDLQDVTITSVADNDLLIYESSTSLWKNKTITAAMLPSAIDAAKIDGGNVSNTEFSYLDGVTSAIQTQIDTKAPIAPRVQTVASSATVTPTSANDLVVITAQAVGLTIANPTGTMVQGQALMIRIKDNGTARSIAYGTNYRALGITLPTTTVISKTTYLGCIWNATDTKFDIVGLNQEV
ncbi:hypothetical protein UFOVP516_9 [uncultured Caudovirales phage]|uniref:Uncharacterized protein n=1 Tax=uncultured Caudovirales phage TaxID=2100421 RepID=A0A6J5MNL4_9CAUD|nr:hypothetical protein UFOVP516_9 [uncultured Caudovirales phage]